MTVNTDELNSTAGALLHLYMTVAAMDGEFEDVEMAKMRELFTEWGITADDLAAARGELAGYSSFTNPLDSITHACNVLKDNLKAKYHVAVVQDLARLSAADGHIHEHEAAIFGMVRERMGVTLADLS